MSGIFGEETIPAPGESPEASGHEEPAAVETEGSDSAAPAAEQPDGEREEQNEQDTDREEGDDADPDDELGHSDDELLAGKYKSPAELAKAYQNAVRKMTELAEENRRLKTQQPPSTQQAPRPGQETDTAEDPNEIVAAALQRDPIGTLNYFIQRATQQALQPLHEERETKALADNIKAVAKEYPKVKSEEGMTTLLGKVAEIAEELGRPELASNPTPRVLRMAAEEAFGSTKADLYKRAKNAGREEAEEARRAKQGAGTPKGAKPAPAAPKTAADEIKEGIMSVASSGGIWG